MVFLVMNLHYFVIFWERKFEKKLKVFFNGKMCVFSQKKKKKVHFWETKEFFFK